MANLQAYLIKTKFEAIIFLLYLSIRLQYSLFALLKFSKVRSAAKQLEQS